MSEASPAAPEALTVEPVGERVYRYSVPPASAWTTADLGRILEAIVVRLKGAKGRHEA